MREGGLQKSSDMYYYYNCFHDKNDAHKSDDDSRYYD